MQHSSHADSPSEAIILLRRAFPTQISAKSEGAPDEREPWNEAARHAIGHELAYLDPKTDELKPTRKTEVRLLNLQFTRALRAIAQRQTGNPFTSTTQTSAPNYAKILRQFCLRDEPNPLQELFIEHFDDLKAYLDAEALPYRAFLLACGLIVEQTLSTRQFQSPL